LAESDEQLVETFHTIGGDEPLQELVERHIPDVRAMVGRMVFDQDLADDLTQEVFLRALRGIGTFQGRSKFSTWLYRIAMNTTHAHLARAARSPVDYDSELAEHPPAEGPGPEQMAIGGETLSKVDAAIRGLSPKLRAAIVLTTLQQMDVREAARIEGCSRATMYWRLHEARRQLRTQLDEYLS